jgi:hypothetical protein
MERAPTTNEKKCVYDYCVASKALLDGKRAFQGRKQPLNRALKARREGLTAFLGRRPGACFRVREGLYLRETTCFSKTRPKEEHVADSVEAVAGAATMEEVVDQITEGIDKARTNRRVYAKLSKKPPRGVEAQPSPSELDEMVRAYEAVDAQLAGVKAEEKTAVAPLKRTADDLTTNVEAYMSRVAIESQRVSLGDKDIQGISHTFFLRRKVKTTKPPLTKKRLREVVAEVLAPFRDPRTFEASREAVANDLARRIEGEVATKTVLAFDKGQIKKR